EAPRETHNGFSLPVPIGARVVTEEIGGIQSSVLYQGEHQEKQESQEKQEHTSELDTLLVARATPDGSDDHSLVASWLGVARDKVVALGHERFLVRQAITDRYVQVERAEGSVNLYSVPSAALLDLLELATELN
ncbi:MAG: hypothetical protein Q8P33_01195, partial [bacterium]|nr:hypothetical protein [bacterium]